jgi:methyl-accepting chemotaxis protein
LQLPGFAVVADEIRKLAESSGEQSGTTGNAFKEDKESIDKIIKSTENVLNEFEVIDAGVKTAAEQEDNIRT